MPSATPISVFFSFCFDVVVGLSLAFAARPAATSHLSLMTVDSM